MQQETAVTNLQWNPVGAEADSNNGQDHELNECHAISLTCNKSLKDNQEQEKQCVRWNWWRRKMTEPLELQKQEEQHKHMKQEIRKTERQKKQEE